MTCTSHHEPADRDLLAYLDGEASAEVEQHLAICAHCRLRAEELRATEARLLSGLYRLECPAPEELGEYHLQLLPKDRAREIRQHVAGCRLCAREIAGLRGYLTELRPDVEHGVLGAVGAPMRVWVARLVGGMASPGLALQPGQVVAAIRGADEGPRIYEAGDIQLSIDVQPDPHQPSHRSLFGLLLGPQSAGFRAHLWQQGTHLISVPVDAAGNFEISGLPPGSYELILEGPDAEVHVQDLNAE